MRACAVILLVHFSRGNEDYWNEDFDPNKNCAKEKEMNELQRETEPIRCASAAGSGDLYLISISFLINFLTRISQNTVG